MNPKPVYEVMPGWQENSAGVRQVEDLPANARAYLKRIEKSAAFLSTSFLPARIVETPSYCAICLLSKRQPADSARTMMGREGRELLLASWHGLTQQRIKA